jgi:Ca2+-dependent lipid-binding protein
MGLCASTQEVPVPATPHSSPAAGFGDDARGSGTRGTSGTASTTATATSSAAASTTTSSGPELTFQITLAHIQVRNLVGKDQGGTSDPFVKFTFDDGGPSEQAFTTAPVLKCLSARWDTVFHFEFRSSVEALARRYLTCTCLDHNDSGKHVVIGYVRFNLLNIAQGPEHHDHTIRAPGKEKEGAEGAAGRVIFGVAMKQISDWEVALGGVKFKGIDDPRDAMGSGAGGHQVRKGQREGQREGQRGGKRDRECGRERGTERGKEMRERGPRIL